MLLTPTTINIALLEGGSEKCDVMAFTCISVEGERVALAVQKISDQLCYILHHATGYKLEASWVSDVNAAARDFECSVATGAIDLDAHVRMCDRRKIINELY